MHYKMKLKIKGREYNVEIEDVTDLKEVGHDSYSKGISNRFSKPVKPSSIKKKL